MKEIAHSLQNERIKNGAILIPRPEITIRVDQAKRITLHVRKKQTPTQFVISELMILTNTLAAGTASEAGIPFPFRCQESPSEDIPVSPDTFDPVIGYRQRRLMNRAYSAVKPNRHFSLGVQEYTNVTSPLRRNFDLIAQRQLKSLMNNDIHYQEDDLQEILYEVETTSVRAHQIRSRRESYWLMKLLSGKIGQTIEAVVLDRFPRRYQVWLKDYHMDADLPIPIGYHLKPGDLIRVVVERVNPQEQALKIRLYE